MTKNYLPLIFLLITLTLTAQPDPAYYNSAVGKSDKALKTALHNIIKVGDRLSYGSGSNSTWSGFEKSDLHPNGYVWDMYSNNKVYFPGNGQVPSGMNIEHSVAKSWWGGGKNDAYKDLYHLNPSNIQANSARGSFPLGINSGGTFNNGAIKVGKNNFGTEYSGDCFEPLDEYKGDFARAYLYMFTCYENLSWTGTSAPTMIKSGETWPMLKPWAKDLLVSWSRQDPVSEKEINRANAIYEFQHNRNPFIDYPELVEYLWGDRVGQPFTTGAVDYPYLSMPTAGYQVNFGTVAYQHTTTLEISIKGHNLNGDLALNISGDNVNLFNIPVNIISKSDAENGFLLQVTYNASSIGSHNAVLNISGGGTVTKSVTLKAVSSDNFMALPATNVGHNTFTANWTVSASATGYDLDVYSIENGSDSEAIELVAEGFRGNRLPDGWSSNDGVYYYSTDKIDGVVRLASGSKDGVISIPNLDLSNLDVVLSVVAKRYGDDSKANLTVKLNGNTLDTWLTESDFKTFSINLPKYLGESTLTFSAQKGQRVYIDSINISSEGEALIKTSLDGYPIRLGNVMTYQVSNLVENNLYYYDVTPIGNNTKVSNRIEVQTTIVNDIFTGIDKPVIYAVHTSLGIMLYNLFDNVQVEVYNLVGNCVYSTQTNDSNILIPLKTKGVYLIKTNSNNRTESIKVFF
ncbi:hypothetical protein MASR2M117_17500 [Paludibacter sp.]